MAKTPQISNADTYRMLGTTPLGLSMVPPHKTDVDSLPSDMAEDTIRIGGRHLAVTNSGRIYGWDVVDTSHDA